MLVECSPRELLALVEGLAAYDVGMFAARLQGGEKWRDFLGWGKDRHMAADTYDAVVKHIFVSAGDNKKPTPYTRPNANPPQRGIPFLQAFRQSKGE